MICSTRRRSPASNPVPGRILIPPAITSIRSLSSPDYRAQPGLCGHYHRNKFRGRARAYRTSLPKLTPPSEDLIAMQPMANRHRRRARAERLVLGNDPRLLRPRPAPTPRSSRDHLQPLKGVTLRCSITVQTSHREPPLWKARSSPRRRRSQGGAGTTLTYSWGQNLTDATVGDPDEVYNLGAQSHVKVSCGIAEYTAEVVAVGTLRLDRGAARP
jgi:hypothetical protein